MTKNRFITGYSGLRAIAVVGVILYHLNPNIFIGGYLGVPIFFVLSGYLVTDHIMRSYDLTGGYDVKGFYLSRLKKLYPPLIAVLWLSAAWIFLFQRNLLAKLNQIVISNLLNVYNFWQIFNGQSYFERFAANASPFTHLWTMSIEGQFYILWPLFIFLLVHWCKKRKYIFWVIFALSLLSALEMALLFWSKADINRIYYGSDTRFFSLGLGAAMAIIWPIEDLRENIEASDTRFLDLTGLIASAGLIWLFFSQAMNPQSAFPYYGGMLLFTFLTVILVAVIAHPGSHWNRFLTNPLFDWISKRSYGIYLYQFPVMIFFEDKFTDIADHPFLYHVTEVVLILLISEISYRLIERPFGKITWSKCKLYLRRIFSLRTGNLAHQIEFVCLFLLFILGSTGIIASAHAKAIDFNKTQLARRIARNRQAQKSENRALIASLRKQGNKGNKNSSKELKEARKNARRHPINRSYEKYGISQVQLQLAHKVSVTAIGDSVMAGSSNDLKQLMPKAIIDAAVSRQLPVAFGLIDNYKQRKVLADNVLIGLGTNGPFQPGDLDRLMHEVGPKRKVFWINTHVPSRPWQGQVNSLLAKSAQKYPNLIIINWYNYSKDHPDWFYQDHTHPTPTGSKYYSAFIVKTIIKHLKF